MAASQNESNDSNESNETPAWRQLEESYQPEKRIHNRISGRMVPVGPDGTIKKDDYR